MLNVEVAWNMLNVEVACDPEIPLPGTLRREMKVYNHNKMWMFVVALLRMAKVEMTEMSVN